MVPTQLWPSSAMVSAKLPVSPFCTQSPSSRLLSTEPMIVPLSSNVPLTLSPDCPRLTVPQPNAPQSLSQAPDQRLVGSTVGAGAAEGLRRTLMLTSSV